MRGAGKPKDSRDRECEAVEQRRWPHFQPLVLEGGRVGRPEVAALPYWLARGAGWTPPEGSRWRAGSGNPHSTCWAQEFILSGDSGSAGIGDMQPFVIEREIAFSSHRELFLSFQIQYILSMGVGLTVV